MVKALHRAGIEVILDVVYNHTPRATTSARCSRSRASTTRRYYRLVPDDPRHYMDFTGTGNSLNPVHPSVLRLIMDSLRYFVIDCHVDGFRFDLASALAREFYDVDRLSAFFDTIHQDPVLSQVKLIAEPWDVGPGGYQVGNFPVLWAEWNGIYRDTMRDFWRGAGERRRLRPALHRARATSTSDDGRAPFASINFVTAHDGFTLRDLVSYNEKHNEANLEDNHDGTDDNRSWNCGVEGPTDDPEINALRARQQRNFLDDAAALAGRADAARRRRVRPHAGRQQQRVVPGQRDLLVRLGRGRARAARVHAAADRAAQGPSGLPARTRSSPAPRRSGSGLPDVWWFRPDGRRMTQRDWSARDAHTLGVFLNGQEIPSATPHGEEIVDDSFLLLFNAHHEPVTFTLPTRRFGARWLVELARGGAAAPRARSLARARGGRRLAGPRVAACCVTGVPAASSAAPTGCS